MHNTQSTDITVNIITTLLHALTEISTVSGGACEHASRDSEYAGAVVPHSLAMIQQRADMAMRQVSAMMLADMQPTGEAENA